jgi:predicted nucleic acid-binding protein
VAPDTNVLVSAFVFPGGAPEAAYRLALERSVDLVTSAPLLDELWRILSDRFLWEPVYVQEALSQVARLADVVVLTETVTTITRDPDDPRVGNCSRWRRGGDRQR